MSVEGQDIRTGFPLKDRGGHWRHFVAKIGAALVRTLEAEQSRWPNWLPVFLGIGIALYFSLTAEPPLWTGFAALSGALALLLLLRRRIYGRLLAVAFLTAAVGYLAILVRSHDVAAPRLDADLAPRRVAGRVVNVDLGNAGVYRLLLENVAIAGRSGDETPVRIRVTVRIDGPVPEPGDRVALRAGLLPPPAPTAPGAYDFGRKAWFERLGAVGYAVTAPEIVSGGARGWRDHWAAWRHAIALDIREALPQMEGGVAAALITGDRSGIPDHTAEALRLSGLAHLLAISGLHLGLVAGIVFFGGRGLLALSPRLALHQPIKKWAAGLAILAAGLYLVLVGAPIPTQRAFLMTALVLTAVILDRTALTMRLVAVAAIIILLLLPESLLSISFQMSFAAVVALIAFYEVMRPHLSGSGSRLSGWRRRWVVYFLGVALTSLVASAATAPFAAFHFSRFAHYGIAANLAAVPLMAFWVMPWAVVGMLLLPVGLAQPALTAMGWGIRLIVGVAETVAAWPGAVSRVSAFSTEALVCMVLGGLWLAIWTQRWRLLGVLPVIVGLLMAVWAPAPDILIDGQGRVIALATPEGEMALSTRRGSRFLLETWRERLGRPEFGKWPKNAAAAATDTPPWLRCDDRGCIYRRSAFRVAIAKDADALRTDCARADVVIATMPAPQWCQPARGLIDRYDLWREGPHAIWLRPGKVRIASVRGYQGDRPWSRAPGQ